MSSKIDVSDLLILVALATVTSSVFTSWFASGGNLIVIKMISAFVLPLSAGAMAISANIPLRFYSRGTLGDAYLYAATAAAFFFLGEAFYAMSVLVAVHAFASYLAQAFIIVAYLFAVIAFLKALKAWEVHRFFPRFIVLYLLVIVVLVVFAVMGFYIMPVFPSWEYYPYVGFDLCILVLALVFVAMFRKSRFGISWILLIVAIAIGTVGDLAEISAYLVGSSGGVFISTLLWSYAYLLAAYSFIKQKFFIS